MPTLDELSTQLRAYAGTPHAPPADAVRSRARTIRHRRTAGRWSTAAVAVALIAGGVGVTTTWLADRPVQPGSAADDSLVVPPGEVLRDAVRADDYAGVRAALDAGSDPNLVGPIGISPLMIAAIRDDAVSAEMLLDAGAYPGTSDEHGRTALVLAAQYGGAEVARLLIDAGAHLEARTYDYRRTAAAEAVRWGHGDVLEVLAAAGANLDARDTSGRTVLHYALDGPQPEARVALLLDLGATPPVGGDIGTVVADLQRTDPDPAR